MIKHLPKDKYEQYAIDFKYETNGYYDVKIIENNHSMAFRLNYKSYEKPLKKAFVDHLYESHNENAKAYGYFVQNELAGLVEVNFEEWNKRLRITELIVFEAYKRHGIGTILMNYAKEKAEANQARMMILETQTCNIPAIRFYQAYGFKLVGIDTSCYSNKDIETKEVRIELGYYL